MIIRLTRLFPLWAVLFSLAALWQPQVFSGLKTWIVPLLSVVMFGMGMTLTLDDFLRAITMPRLILAGMVMQYLFMPLAAVAIATAFQLEPLLLVGMILVGACPGGTASNVICYLARGNVALSITLTACSTLLAILATPLITLLLADTRIEVPAINMLISIARMVLLPVTLGVLVNHFFGRRLEPVKHVFPLLSVGAIVLIIAIIVALNAETLPGTSILLVLAVILHNLAGLSLGYLTSRLLGYSITDSRTLAIEVGMQNSGLAVALAIKHFSTVAALPGAMFSIWHNLSGSVLASYWSNSQIEKKTGIRN